MFIVIWYCLCLDKSSGHYSDVIMGGIASQITSLTIVYSTVYSDADQRRHQSSASLAFVRGIHRRPVNSPHKGPVTRKMFPFDDVIMGDYFTGTGYHTARHTVCSLQWRHNGRDSVSNHRRLHCLLNRLFRRRSKKASKLLITGLCEGNSPVTGEFPSQRASNVENVSIWWRHPVWISSSWHPRHIPLHRRLRKFNYGLVKSITSTLTSGA